MAGMWKGRVSNRQPGYQAHALGPDAVLLTISRLDRKGDKSGVRSQGVVGTGVNWHGCALT